MKLILLFSVLLVGTVHTSPPGKTYAGCKKNELFYEYTTHHEASCENPIPETKTSENSVCRCDRESGFLRNTTTGECVKADDCNPPVILCGENELIDPCTLGCEPSCDNPTPTNCTQKCVSGCQCKRGYLRRGDNKCVLDMQCKLPPTKCPENEFLADFYTPSNVRKCSIWTGDEFHNKPWPFLLGSTKGCSCNEGLFRNNEGRCVKEADCKPPGYECKGNETFTERKRHCEASCRTPKALGQSYSAKPGCKCMDGFLRNSQGECIKEEDCPYEDPKNKCKSVECREGNQCLMHEGRPICIPSSAHCFAFPCPAGSTCQIVNNRPRCLTKTCDDIRCGTIKECAEVRYANNTDPSMKPLCYEIQDHWFVPDVCYVTHCPEESTYVLREPKCTEPKCNPVAKLESLEAQALEGKQCRINEMFSTCKTSCSETKCNEKPKKCPKSAMAKVAMVKEECNGKSCVCQEGFFRDRFGDCVTQVDCDIQKKDVDRLSRESD